MSNPFFKNNGPIKFSKIIKSLELNIKVDTDREIHDIKDLIASTDDDITFFHSNKYRDVAKKQKHLFV